MPENIVDRDQASAADERQRALIIVLVVGFVRVNERHVVRFGLAVREKRLECVERGTEPQVDTVFDSCFTPCLAGAGCELLAAVAGDYLAARRQRERDPSGAV